MNDEELLTDKKKSRPLTKSEVISRRILSQIHRPTLDSGGTFSVITGSPGSAKTSTMLSFCDYAMRHHPKHKLFFSNSYGVPLQFVKLGADCFDILVKEGSNVSFHDRSNRRKQIYPQITEFKDFEECYELARPGRLNAVFFGDRYLQMDFLHFLLSVGEWKHYFVDEIGEIAPAFTSGEWFHKIGQFALDLKECRKTLTSYCCNTQSIPGIDHRVIAVIMVKIYLPGARASKNGRVTQRAIDNLKIDQVNGNQAYLEAYGQFGKTTFKNIFSPSSQMLWEAKSNVKK